MKICFVFSSDRDNRAVAHDEICARAVGNIIHIDNKCRMTADKNGGKLFLQLFKGLVYDVGFVVGIQKFLTPVAFDVLDIRHGNAGGRTLVHKMKGLAAVKRALDIVYMHIQPILANGLSQKCVGMYAVENILIKF